MKVYIVKDNYYNKLEVYANRKDAEERAEYLEYCAGCEGSNEMFWVEEKEVK